MFMKTESVENSTLCKSSEPTYAGNAHIHTLFTTDILLFIYIQMAPEPLKHQGVNY